MTDKSVELHKCVFISDNDPASIGTYAYEVPTRVTVIDGFAIENRNRIRRKKNREHAARKPNPLKLYIYDIL